MMINKKIMINNRKIMINNNKIVFEIIILYKWYQNLKICSVYKILNNTTINSNIIIININISLLILDPSLEASIIVIL